jgi:hypothetical protein
MHTKLQAENVKGRDSLGDLSIGGLLTLELKCISNRYCEAVD